MINVCLYGVKIMLKCWKWFSYGGGSMAYGLNGRSEYLVQLNIKCAFDATVNSDAESKHVY